MTSGKTLKLIRKPKMTLEQLSEATGISQSQLSRFECGRREPRLEDAIKIAKALNVTVQQIFPELENKMSNTHDFSGIAFAALVEAVRRSYYMLGLDGHEADVLLSLVLQRAKGLTAHPVGEDRRSLLPDDEVRKFLKLKTSQDD